MFACLICLCVCLCVCVFVCLFVCLFACLFVCLFVCFFVSLFVCLFVCLFVFLCFCLFVWFVCLCFCLFVSLLCFFVSVFLCLFVLREHHVFPRVRRELHAGLIRRKVMKRHGYDNSLCLRVAAARGEKIESMGTNANQTSPREKQKQKTCPDLGFKIGWAPCTLEQGY